MDKKHWFYCTNCGQKLMRYSDKAISEKVYIKCKSCKKEIEVKIKK